MAACHVSHHSKTSLLLAVMALLAAASGDEYKHGWDHSVCSAYSSSAHKKPDLPSSYSLRVEVNILDKNTTSALQEFYSYDSNIGAVHQMEEGSEAYYFYYYKTNQYLSVYADDQGGYTCYSENLSTNDNNEMFGLQATKNGTDRIYSVQGALHFGGPDVSEQYVGQERVRGILCDKWLSCQYWQGLDATANVTWYFSNKTEWKTVSQNAEPVRCVVQGVMWVNKTYSRPFNHIYEFYNFQPDLQGSDDVFEVPANTYCFSEKNTKAVPSMPPAYSFNAEFLDVNRKAIAFVKELYDSKAKIAREDYWDPPKFNSPNGTRYTSLIHDYNTGVSYTLDVQSAACSASQIPQTAVDAASSGMKYVRMRSPGDFLALNRSYQYQGTRNIRGINCDAWSVIRFDYPDSTSQNNPASVWTWYFATNDWMSAMGYHSNLVLPVMLEFFSEDTLHYMMQIYDFSAEEPDLGEYDVSSCYDPLTSKNVAFLVPGSFHSVVGTSLKTFKSYVRQSLQRVMGVSPLRISRLDVQEAGLNVLITFDLLDKAPLPGDVANPMVEKDVTTAYNVLMNALNTSTMVITLGSDIRSFVGKPAGAEYQFYVPSRFRNNGGASTSSASNASSSHSFSSSSSGYSGATMGGMATGMLVLGALLGFLGVFLFFRFRPGGAR